MSQIAAHDVAKASSRSVRGDYAERCPDTVERHRRPGYPAFGHINEEPYGAVEVHQGADLRHSRRARFFLIREAELHLRVQCPTAAVRHCSEWPYAPMTRRTAPTERRGIGAIFTTSPV